MDYNDYKIEVLHFFDDYVLKYLITDLEKLNQITADQNGIGGCTIPQAITTFTAIDLFGYLLETQAVGNNIVNMRLKPFLRNESLFPDISFVSDVEKFIDSFKDDIRSAITHRFFLMNYDIGKFPGNALFIQNGMRRIFNVSYFTRTVIDSIKNIRSKIEGDTFIAKGDSTKEETIKRIYDRLELLKNFQSPAYIAVSSGANPTNSSTTTTETTPSLNP